MIRQRNKDFITESKLFSDGGDYSVEEIEWYEKMMKDIYDSVKKHQENRQKKAEELSQLLQTKK